MTLVFILSAWLMADFLSGVFHWWEDRYGVEDWPIIGPLVVSPNIMHHSQPKAFLENGFIGRNWTTFVPCILLAGIFWCLGSPWWTLVFAFASMGNEIHAWAHQKCSRRIRGLQMLGVIQSQEQHANHHTQPFDRNYCVMTDWVNPVLQAVGFWWAVEAWIYVVSGVQPRPERQTA